MKKGSQKPTRVIEPAVKSPDVLDGRDAAAFAKRFGLVLDPWQRSLCELWLRRDDSGQWAAGTWGISVPRQNGKNGTLEAVELYGMVILGLNFLHTAHEVKTARKAFRRLREFFGEKANDPHAKFPELNRYVREVRNTNGQEAIFLSDPNTGEELGSVEVVARSGGSARGFTNDVLVLDEAQHLKDDELEALRPTISAAPSGDPVAIYMGTPPKPSALADEGEGAAFVRIRNGAVLGENERAAWMEFGLDADLEALSVDEIATLARDMSNSVLTNPALGRRLFEKTLMDELAELGPRSYCRERLNIWPVARKTGEGFLDFKRWGDLALTEVPDYWRLAAIGLDMDPVTGRLWVSPAVHAEQGAVHVELIEDDLLANGTEAAVTWLFRRVNRRLPVVMCADSPATVLVAPLLALGVRVYQLNGPETIQACGAWVSSMKEGTLSHFGDPVLEVCIRESERKPGRSAGQFTFKRGGEFHAAPLYAAAAASFGAVKWSRRRNPGRTSGRFAVSV